MRNRWLSTFNNYIFSVQHKSGKLIHNTNALNKHADLLETIHSESLAIDYLKDFYVEDEDFVIMWEKCSSLARGADNFLVHEGFFQWKLYFHSSRIIVYSYHF